MRANIISLQCFSCELDECSNSKTNEKRFLMSFNVEIIQDGKANCFFAAASHETDINISTEVIINL